MSRRFCLQANEFAGNRSRDNLPVRACALKTRGAIRRRRKNQSQNYTRLFLKGRPGNYLSFVVILNSVISKTKRRALNKLFTKGYINPRRRAMGKSRLVCCRSNAYFLLTCEEEIYSNMRGRQHES